MSSFTLEKFKVGDLVFFVSGRHEKEMGNVTMVSEHGSITECLIMSSQQQISSTKENLAYAIKVPTGDKATLLKDRIFSFVGNLKENTPAIKKKIECHGGIIKKLGPQTTDIISPFDKDAFPENITDGTNLGTWWLIKEFWVWVAAL